VVDDQQRAAGLERGEQAPRAPWTSALRHRADIEVVHVLHGDDRVERLGKRRRGDRAAQRDDIGPAGDSRVLLVAVGGAEGDEFVGLEGIDLALGPTAFDSRRVQ
jgi:hypothetical protein